MSKEKFAPLLAVLQSVIEADDQVTPEEAEWMSAVVEEAGVSVPESSRLDAETLRKSLPKKEDREDFVRLMFMLSLADGVTDDKELEIIAKVASWLEVPEERVEELRQETKVSVGSS